MAQLRYYAVLTGDIIGSSRLRSRQLESVRSSLIDAVAVVRRWKRGLVKGPEFFRGDGWQLLLSDPALAMRVGIFLRASLLAGGVADSRVATGLGAGEEAPSRRVALATGQAFVLSGRALDGMTRYSSMTIEMPKSSGPLADWMPVIGHLCGALIDQWTRRQAEIVCVAINPKEPDYERVAQSLKPAVSKQAVAKGLNGANWHVIREAIHRFEEMPWEVFLQAEGASKKRRPAQDNQKWLSGVRQPKKVDGDR
jgi:hypothetical protein